MVIHLLQSQTSPKAFQTAIKATPAAGTNTQRVCLVLIFLALLVLLPTFEENLMFFAYGEEGVADGEDDDDDVDDCDSKFIVLTPPTTRIPGTSVL